MCFSLSDDPPSKYYSRLLKMGLYLGSVLLIYLPVFMTIPYYLNITIVYNVLKSGSVGPLALTFSKLLWIF